MVNFLQSGRIFLLVITIVFDRCIAEHVENIYAYVNDEESLIISTMADFDPNDTASLNNVQKDEIRNKVDTILQNDCTVDNLTVNVRTGDTSKDSKINKMILERIVKIQAVHKTLKFMWHASAHSVSETILTKPKTLHLDNVQNYSVRERATVIANAEMETFVIDNTPSDRALSSNIQGKYKTIKFINPKVLIPRITIINHLWRVKNFQQIYVETDLERQLNQLTGYDFTAVMVHKQYTFTIEKRVLRVEPNENIIRPCIFSPALFTELKNIDEIYIHEESPKGHVGKWWRPLIAINREIGRMKFINLDSLGRGFADLLKINYEYMLQAYSNLSSFTFSYFGFEGNVDDQAANINELCVFLRINLANLNELGLVSEKEPIDASILGKIPNSQLESFERKEIKYYVLLIKLGG